MSGPRALGLKAPARGGSMASSAVIRAGTEANEVGARLSRIGMIIHARASAELKTQGLTIELGRVPAVNADFPRIFPRKLLS